MRRLKMLLLMLLLLVILVGCANNTTNNTNNLDIDEEEGPISTNVSIEEAKELIKNTENLLVLDVRTKGEYEAGHIEGAVQIPVDELTQRLDELEEFKDKPILVYCRSGNRSSQAVNILLDNNFNKIYHMNEGFMRWN